MEFDVLEAHLESLGIAPLGDTFDRQAGVLQKPTRVLVALAI